MLHFFLIFGLCWLVSLRTNLNGVLQRCALIHAIHTVALGLWQTSQFNLGVSATEADWLTIAAFSLCSCAASICLLIVLRWFRSFRISLHDVR